MINGNELTVFRGQGGTTSNWHFIGAQIRLDGFWAVGDQTGTAASPLNAQIGPLADNGGPTPTHELLPGSPAIDVGSHTLNQTPLTTLSLAMDGSATVLKIPGVLSLPEAPFHILVEDLVEDELMLVVAAQPHQLIVQRAQGGTAAGYRPAGTAIFLLADQRGASRYFDDGTGILPIDAGAYERLPVLSLESIGVSANEGDSGVTSFIFNVARYGVSSGTTTVEYSVIGAGANPASASDFSGGVFPSGSITFTGAETQKQITINIAADAVVEADEGFRLILKNPSPATDILLSSAEGTILNDETATITVADVTQAEGSNVGTTDFVFNVVLDKAVEGAFDLGYTTRDDLAATGDWDYADQDADLEKGYLTFAGAAGETHPITISVFHDLKVERDETFEIVLGALYGISDELAAQIDVQLTPAMGTIENDDFATLTVENVRFLEGDSGTSQMEVEVVLSAPVDIPFTVDVDTADVEATAGQDYTALSQTLNFAGLPLQTHTLLIDVQGDLDDEDEETFTISLSNLQAAGREAAITLVDGVQTIVDDEGPVLWVSDVEAYEGDSGTTAFVFEVTLINPPQGGGGVSVTASTVAVTAEEGVDYQANSEVLGFSGVHGEVQNFTVLVYGDTIVEPDETFLVQLSGLSAGGNESLFSLIDGKGTILNDDSTAIIASSTDAYIDEDQDFITFTFQLTNEVQGPLYAFARTYDGTAMSGDQNNPGSIGLFGGPDHDSVTTILPIGAIEVPMIDDDEIEPVEEIDIHVDFGTPSEAWHNLQPERRLPCNCLI